MSYSIKPDFCHFGPLASRHNHILGCTGKMHLIWKCYPNFFWGSRYIEQENTKFCCTREMYTKTPSEPILQARIRRTSSNSYSYGGVEAQLWNGIVASWSVIEKHDTRSSLMKMVQSWWKCQLCCDHEKADTRLLLHAKHASSQYSDIMIRNMDTDVLALAWNPEYTILYLMMGAGSTSRIVNTSAILNW